MAKVCGACGQAVPWRWRNRRPALHVHHRAGAVDVRREPPRAGYPWGRIADRIQCCLDCGAELSRGPWAVPWPFGATVLEVGPGMITRVLAPQSAVSTPNCVETTTQGNQSSGILATVLVEEGPRERLRRSVSRSRTVQVKVTAEDLEYVLDELDNLTAGQRRHTAGRPPYGWRANKGTLVPLHEEQEVLAIMHQLRDAGATWRGIATELTNRGIHTRSGTRWLANGVRLSLSLPINNQKDVPVGGEKKAS